MFPSELMNFPHWVCWRSELNEAGKPTKRPYNPHTGKLASPTNPADWSDYQTATKVAANGNNYSGIGFVLTENDPYCMIDLDDPEGNQELMNRQIAISNAFNTYQEVSPSGKGLRIICKAKIATGRHPYGIGIFSNMRYMTLTGNTYKNLPINDCNMLANRLWDELGDGKPVEDLKVLSFPEQYTDEVIKDVAMQANNGEKFLDLWNGNWPKHYKSQSEADYAIINILGFYSRNAAQIKRLFLASELGKRDKAKRPVYLDTMVKKSFDNLPPLIQLDELMINTAKQLAEKRKIISLERATAINPFQGPLFSNVPDPNYDWTRPPGLLGDIANFIYDAAPRPVKEIALAASIGLMAGICGRAYNVSNTGLNQYVLLLAKTGVGKEGAKSGIDKLIRKIKPQVAGITEFLGPGDISSGPAIIRYIVKHQCFVSIVGEFGYFLEGMHPLTANSAQLSLKRKLLALYNQSGFTDILDQSVYADDKNNIGSVRAPAFSILGESTPETFYRNIDESMINDGLLPRFLAIEYLGPRPPNNENASLAEASPDLLKKLGDLAAQCLAIAEHNRVINVDFKTLAGAEQNAYQFEIDRHINSSDQVITRELWNRAWMKTMKVASLIAIGENMYNPVISVEAFTWAKNLVERDIFNVLSKFETGKAGKESGELNQINELVNAISNYVKRSYALIKGYGVLEDMHRDGVIPHSYIQRKLSAQNAFKYDKMGSKFAIERTLNSLKDEGSIREMRATDLYMRYNKTTMKAYYVVDVNRFL